MRHSLGSSTPIAARASGGTTGGSEVPLNARIGDGIQRGAKVGLIVGVGLAVLYLALGVRVNEFTELIGYSLLLVGFPTVFAILPVLKWLGIQGGMGEYVPLVSLTLSINGIPWGALLGALQAWSSSTHHQDG
jgi:hypothetical protein